MSRIAATQRDVARKNVVRRYLPILSVLLACLLALLPIIVSTALVPDIAFLTLVAWRLLRPEMWTPNTALGLGLFNDLVAGHPLGQSMALWTIVFLAFEIVDAKLNWRDYWTDWLFASLAIIFYTFSTWYISGLMGSRTEFAVMVPQLALSVLGYPVVQRAVLGLDRWRLSR